MRRAERDVQMKVGRVGAAWMRKEDAGAEG